MVVVYSAKLTIKGPDLSYEERMKPESMGTPPKFKMQNIAFNAFRAVGCLPPGPISGISSSVIDICVGPGDIISIQYNNDSSENYKFNNEEHVRKNTEIFAVYINNSIEKWEL